MPVVLVEQARVHHNHSEFVALQALECDARFYLWTRAGRVGCAGKTALTGPFDAENKVVSEFCALFASHTQCEWDERRHLQRARPYQDGRYVVPPFLPSFLFMLSLSDGWA